MTLEELAARISGLAALKHSEKIKLFSWWLHTQRNMTHLRALDVKRCYSDLVLAPPVNLNQQMDDLVRQRIMLKDGNGYRLERSVSEELAGEYGKRPAAIHVEKLLANLPSTLPTLKEQEYLEETIKCLRAGAFRATVVMAWNLAYDHLCYWILFDTTRLSDFNARSPVRFPRIGYPPVTKREDFFDMKESHVIEIASSAGLISPNIFKVLKEKLDRRNMAAHPTDVSTLQQTAEEIVRDLVENVVLKLT